MADITDAQLDNAIGRGKRSLDTEPRALSARYDRHFDRLVVDLTNGCTFAFPPRLAHRLEQATPDQLAAVEVLG